MSKVVQSGSTVTIHYRIRLEDGTEALSSHEEGEPLHFTLGDGTMLPTLEQHLIDLEPGFSGTFILGPEEAFGQREEGGIHPIPRQDFAPGVTLEPGLIVSFATPNGEEIPGAVMEVGEDVVMVDFNHPLAGHTLTFEVEILAVD